MRLLYATNRRKDAYLLKALGEVGHTVTALDLPDDALFLAGAGAYDAIVLDGEAPRVDRIAKYRAAAPDGLIVAIAAKGDAQSRTALLRAGADLCFTRPFEFRELNARMEALARRAPGRPAGDEPAIRLSPNDRSALVGETRLPLSAREYALLDFLLAHEGEVVTVAQLLEQVWGDAERPPALARTYLGKLRAKLEPALGRELVRAVRGHGYAVLPPR